ncbi:RNA polymerase sigma factor [Algimonas ampicilliniresistens]|uniref:RNA polymerase sigma factor n=1 Tax=Algimonas ampicilliniresistens TaxID=1298735 RepID=A0ABQ5V4U0_9PROT|nr:sigma-70 family RNA polymerase sigma factor [Algimonas ampicilliniresistens]GLQ22549.1 RNA polymerase sigma factor [Algimonas ampicilliniresistens]
MTRRTERNDKYTALNAELAAHLSDCAAGNRNAFAEIYRLTSGKFTAILMGMIHDEATCADIMQKAYVSIWTNAYRYDPVKGKAFTWMLVIMRNRALDALRARSRYRETVTLSGPIIERLEDDGPSPAESTKAWMISRLLAPHLAQLAPDVAEAVKLSTVDGMSAREIGESLGVPTNTAKSWVRRGLQRMRKDIERSGDAKALNELV